MKNVPEIAFGNLPNVPLYRHSFPAHSQTTIDGNIENVFDAWFDNTGNEEEDFLGYLTALDEYKNEPLDLNELKEHDLDNFFFLTDLQKNDLLSHSSIVGYFLCLEELQSIPSLDENTILMLRPFLKVENLEKALFTRSSMKEGNRIFYVKWKQKSKSNLETELADTTMLGSAAHWVIRYKWEGSSVFKAGFVAETDGGESIVWDKKRKWADYFSCYFQLKRKWKWIHELIIGDFAPSFGQGLIVHNGFGAGKTSMVMLIRKQGAVFRPYTSVNETGYFRGIANVLNLSPSLKMAWLFSNKDIDAHLSSQNQDSTQSEIVSILKSGYHRTLNELGNKQNANQKNIGIQLQWTHNRATFSINHLSYFYSMPIAKGNDAYELYNFHGKNNHLTSIDWKWSFKNFSTFGELARSHNNGWAVTSGVLLSLDKTIDLCLHYRNYGLNYVALDGSALGESSKPQAEKGIYLGTEWRPAHKWKIAAYLDFWQFPWMRYQIDAPSNGKELLVRIEHTIKRKFNVYLQYFLETKEINENYTLEKIEGLSIRQRHKIRLHYAWQVHPFLELRTRAEINMVILPSSSEKGHLLYQDIIYHPKSSPLSLTARMAIFQTDGYNSRIYAYENDLLYESALPFMAGIGRRGYFNLRYKFHKSITAEFRFAQTSYQNNHRFYPEINQSANSQKRLR
ncbi:MAG: hypothetical protein IPH36_00475 [Saprospiraceae bacterium]|nr:hypothetical protein [Saprospiraceae bacterium]